MAQRIFDIHPHVIADDPVAYPPAPHGGKKSDWSDEHDATVESLLVAMDTAGVEKAAVIQSASAYGYDNSYLIHSVAKAPQRLTGVASIDMAATGVARTIQDLAGRGISGLRIYTGGASKTGGPVRLDDPATYDAWAAAGDAGFPVCIQAGPEELPEVVALARRFAGTRIVLDNIARVPLEDGAPFAQAAAHFALADHANVFHKLTPRTLSDAKAGAATYEAVFPKLVEVFGADRIAFGTNYPSKGRLPDILAKAGKALAHVTPEAREWIFFRTAQKLYPALAD